MSYGYRHKLLKIYVYTLETGNLEMMNSLKICILTTTVVYIYIEREREREREIHIHYLSVLDTKSELEIYYPDKLF